MNDLPSLILMFMAGALLAGVYLAGLWFTLRTLHKRRHPALWMVTSMVLRMGLVMFVFFLILDQGPWQLLLATVAGFITLRLFTVHWMRRRIPGPDPEKEETA